jgi:hypothetical protein
MFTLPVSTSALAGWPMLYGTAAMAVLWLATRLFALWPTGVDVPLIWPALLAASLLSWTQALTWMPYGLPGLRVIVAVLWLGLIDAVALLALNFKAPEPVMLAILAPHIPLAYFASRFAIARARRGDVPDWRGLFVRLGQIADVRSRRRAHFPSPARAQLWFEWRRYGRSLPALVAILLPFELAMLFIVRDTPALVFDMLVGVLLTPPIMAAFVAATERRSSSPARNSYGVTPFIATRPLTTAALVAARLKMTIWSTLAAWLLVLVAIPVALIWSDTWPVVIQHLHRLSDHIGTPRAVALVLLIFSAAIVSTWKQLVQSLYIGLSGRAWAVKASVFVTLVFLSVLGPVLQWIVDNPRVEGVLWDDARWTLALLVCIKMFAAVWVVTRLWRSGLLSDRALITGAACWTAAVLALYGVLAWFLFAPHMAGYFLVCVAILAVPLVRLSATPLALEWNRHR